MLDNQCKWMLVGVLGLLGACQTGRPLVDSSALLKPGIYSTQKPSQPIDRKALDNELKSFTYLLIGESHDSPEDHALQADIYRELTAQGARIALGMEMFQTPFQPPLNQYIRKEIDEEQMLIATEYDSRWGFDPDFYSPLWSHAQSLNLAIVALNAHRELTKRVSAVGTDKLSPAEKAELPEMDLTSDSYRTWLRDIFAGHGMTLEPAKFERFFQAQVLWDERMAQSAVEFMAKNPDYTQIVMIVGRGHVERGWGIPDRIRRRQPDASLAVILRVPAGTPAHEAAALADYVIVE